MHHSPTSRFALIGLAALLSLAPQAGRAQDADKAAKQPAAERGPWRAFGRVTDPAGRPMAGVEVRASTGKGTLLGGGATTSDADGRYELYFGPGFLSRDRTVIQAAIISARKSGYFEANLSRQGGCSAAYVMPGEGQKNQWSGRKVRLFLPDRPLELNFVMRPATRVAGKLVDEQGQPLVGYSVSLTGADLYPATSVMGSVRADDQGRFALEDIPTTFRFQFQVSKADPKPPWDDSWASAALQFQQPGKDDLHAWFGKREIRLQEFVLRVTGPGVHERTALPIAGNAGVLNLTADPRDVREHDDVLLSAKSAVLTLRYTAKPDLSQSLIKDSVPAAAAAGTSSHGLARTRANEAGEFNIVFENPRGFDLARGKNQVIFQVAIGESKKPVQDVILRQIDIREGRYEVPVKIPPEWIDDSRVSITFVTIQPNHDEWVSKFFKEGKGTSYSRIWTGASAVVPAIPFVNAGSP